MSRCAKSSLVLAAILTIVVCALWPTPSRAAPNATVENAVAQADRWKRDRKRDERSKPAAVLSFSGVQPGMTVLDLFSGGGYWAELFARAVGDRGQVVAHTNTAYRNFAGPLLDSRFRDGRIPNVTVLDAEINDLMLGREKFDLIFIGLGYHDIYFYADFSPLPGRDHFFDQIRTALKPDGHVVIVDHVARAGAGNRDVQALHRIEPAFARADWERAGFKFVASSEALHNPADDHQADVFAESIRRQTDRFIMRFKRR